VTSPPRLSKVRPDGWLTAAGACLLVLPGLGRFGLWTPEEADRASAALTFRWSAALPALGLHILGRSETAARLPGALVALLTLLVVAQAGRSWFSRRAGWLAAVLLASFPLFVLQARQLTSDLLPGLGVALALAGLGRATTGIAGRNLGTPLWPLGLAGLGLALATFGAGVLGGALPLLGATAIAFATDLDPRHGHRSRRTLAWVAAAVTAGLVVALIAVRHRAGQHSWWLGGVPRLGGSTAAFDGALEVLGFGLFPLGGLAFFGFFALLGDDTTAIATAEPDTEASRSGAAASPTAPIASALAARLLLAHAALSLALATVQLHLVGHATLTLLPTVALALGALFDRQLHPAAAPSPTDDATTRPPANPLLAFVAMVGAMLVARDLTLVPEALVSSHLFARITWPNPVAIAPLVLATGALSAIGLGLLLGAPSRWSRRARTVGLGFVLGPSIALAFTLAHHVVPTLAQHLSAKAQLDHFRTLARPGSVLALYRVAPQESGVFDPPATRTAANLQELIRELRPEHAPSPTNSAPNAAGAPRFALVPRSELAPLEAAFAEAAVPFAVVDASSSRLLLLASPSPAGARDDNPLRPFIWHRPSATASAPPGAPSAITPPPPWADAALPARATWAAGMALLSAEFPARVRRGRSITLTLVFRVLARPPAGQKICVHLEHPGQPLFNGDHAPVEGAFTTDHWRPGDVIRDVHVFEVPRMTTAPGRYRLLIGFWPGGDGARLAITAGSNDGTDRVPLGTIEIE
jgi:4-amino-4-deoxy-L-arabinose transferase-like glycosyltransferase